MSETKKRVTIKDLARLTGVSIGTIDRVLHQRGEVAAKTRDRVLETARKYNYQPNLLARLLVTGGEIQLAVVLPRHAPHEYWAEPLAGATAAVSELSANKVGLSVHTFNRGDPDSFRSLADEVLASSPHGVILTPVHRDAALDFTAQLRKAKVPFVLIDANLPGSGALSFIGQHAFDAGRLAAKLMTFDHRNDGALLPLFVGQPAEYDNPIIVDRTKGFRRFLRDRGVDDRLLQQVQLGEGDHDQLADLLAGQTALDGIFCPNSKAYLVAAALARTGLHPTARLVGFDLLPPTIEHLKSERITFSIYQRPREQGERAVNLLHRHLLLRRDVPATCFTPLEIITRENVHYHDQAFRLL
jgi:LacI family transcriptional regulator